MLKACLWHDTQNHSPIRRIKVETDEIRDLFLEQRVIRDLESLREMRLQRVDSGWVKDSTLSTEDACAVVSQIAVWINIAIEGNGPHT